MNIYVELDYDNCDKIVIAVLKDSLETILQLEKQMGEEEDHYDLVAAHQRIIKYFSPVV